RAALNPGRTVADDPVELVAQFPNDGRDAILGQGILVLSLRRGEQPKAFQAFVAYECLGKLRNALYDIDEVENDTALGTHHQIEIAQADVKVDHHDLLPRERQRGTQSGGCRCLADTAFTGRHHNYLRHILPLPTVKAWSTSPAGLERIHSTRRPPVHRFR